MKHIIYILGIVTMLVGLVSCGNQDGGKKFNPTERQSSLTDAERSEAIAAKRAALQLNIDTLLYSHGVKFSVIRPKAQGEDITDGVADRISTRLLEIACQNGISGAGISPFVLGVEIAQTGRAATGTAPQKMTVKYNFTFKVVNTASSDVYATLSQEVVGVGNSFEEANMNVAQNIQNTPQIQKMLQTASDRIIKWYSENLPTLKSQVSSAEGEGNYALALALVESVPQQATVAFQYASQQQPALLKKLQQQHASETLAALRGAIAEAGDEFSPVVAGCLKMVPSGTPEANQANTLYDAYQKRLRDKADADNRRQELEAKLAHETELAQIEADKLKCKYEQMANAKAMEKAMRYESDQRNKGFWAKLGDRIISGIDHITNGSESDDWD